MVNCATYRHLLRNQYLTPVLVVLITLALGFGRLAEAKEPVALIVGIDGAGADPQVTPFTEITDGTTLRLAPETRITFMHYQRCEEVIVENGVLTLRADTFRLIGGDIIDRSMRGCPPTGDTVSEHGLGGVLFRGQSVLQVSPSGVVVLAGSRSRMVSKARIRAEEDGSETTIRAIGGLLYLQDPGSGFQIGRQYDVDLLSADSTQLGSFMITPSRASGSLSVIRVD